MSLEHYGVISYAKKALPTVRIIVSIGSAFFAVSFILPQQLVSVFPLLSRLRLPEFHML